MDDESTKTEESSGSTRANETNTYLKYIRNIPLLTPEQECALAEKMRMGRRAAARLLELEQGGSSADPREAEQCAAAIRAGDRAKRQLVEGTLRFAAYVAMKFRNRGIAVIDLIQEANIALINAADNWDCSFDYRFVSYASACIKGALTNSCARISVIHISEGMIRAVKKVDQVSRVMQLELGRVPTPQSIAQELNVSVDIVEKIMEASQLAQNPVSLDAPLTEDGESILADLIPDSTATDPEALVTATMLHEKMDHVLRTLEPQEEKVIRLRFGFEDGAVHPLADVAAVCAATLEDTQLMEIKALRKLRHPSRSAQFVGYLE